MRYKLKLLEDDRPLHEIKSMDLKSMEKRLKNFWRLKFK